MVAADTPPRDQIRSAVLRQLAPRMAARGLAADSLGDDFDLVAGELLDSFALVELVVGVSEDLRFEMDLGDLAEQPFETFGQLVDAMVDAIAHAAGRA